MLFLTNFVAPTAPAFTPASKQYNPTALDWVAPEVPDFIPQSYNNISTAVSVKFLDVFFLFLNYVLLLQLSLFFFFFFKLHHFPTNPAANLTNLSGIRSPLGNQEPSWGVRSNGHFYFTRPSYNP